MRGASICMYELCLRRGIVGRVDVAWQCKEDAKGRWVEGGPTMARDAPTHDEGAPSAVEHHEPLTAAERHHVRLDGRVDRPAVVALRAVAALVPRRAAVQLVPGEARFERRVASDSELITEW